METFVKYIETILKSHKQIQDNLVTKMSIKNGS